MGKALTFEVLAGRIPPFIVHEKIRLGDRSLRIWSTCCAMGEEPYSVAILIHELHGREELVLEVHIFATNIDARVLKDVYHLKNRRKCVSPSRYPS